MPSGVTPQSVSILAYQTDYPTDWSLCSMIRSSILLTLTCCYLMWAITYMAQLHPLMGEYPSLIACTDRNLYPTPFIVLSFSTKTVRYQVRQGGYVNGRSSQLLGYMDKNGLCSPRFGLSTPSYPIYNFYSRLRMDHHLPSVL